MAKLNAGNNSQTLLDGAITDTDTSMTVLDGSIFPDTPFAVTIEDEIIYVFAKSGNIFSSLLRGQEGTAAAAHAKGVSVENRMTAGMYNALATQEEVDEHKADDTKHITSTERTIWNNKLDASAYTAADVLAKVKTVDGDGSGLDADLLDGAHAGNGPNNVLKLDSGGFVPLPNIPGTLTGKSADMVDGKHFSDIQNDAQAKVDTHANLTNNPHSVTKSQVGLGSVSNYGLATQAEAEAGTSSAKYMTPLRTKQAIDALQAVKSVAGKTGTVTLTKGDVGLSNVDNTSDMDKPISTATQTALANKVDNSRVLTDVPANAKFTDTTYSEITTAEIDAGTSSTRRTISGRRIKYIIDQVSTMISTAIGLLTKSDIGLGNVDNVQQATKVEFNTHNTDTTRHITSEERTKWNTVDNKVDNSRVLTDVPSGAKFTDTITTINGKTGAITKADIVALGIPAQDTIYNHPSTHPASMITESTSRRFVSDAEKSTWNSKAEISDIPTKVSQLENDKNYVTQAELGDAGLGDMTKGVYDANNNGKVDIAEVAETVVGNEIQLGGRFKLVYNDIEDSLDFEVLA